MTQLLERRKALHRKVEDFQNQCMQIAEEVENLQPLANLGLNWAMTAHEMNNLLMPISNYARLAIANPQDHELTEKSLQKILKLSERAALVMEKVMAMARPGGSQRGRYALCELLDDVFTCIGRDFSKDKVQVIRQVAPNVCLHVEKTSIQQVLLNLILNAYQAMSAKGGLLRITGQESQSQVTIEVTDNGPGIPQEQLKHIFDPFFTRGKASGKGLGLAFCRKVVEAHGGCISADSQPGQGTWFRIVLPMASC